MMMANIIHGIKVNNMTYETAYPVNPMLIIQFLAHHQKPVLHVAIVWMVRKINFIFEWIICKKNDCCLVEDNNHCDTNTQLNTMNIES